MRRIAYRMTKKLRRHGLVGFNGYCTTYGVFFVVGNGKVRPNCYLLGSEPNEAWAALNHFIHFVKEGRDACRSERV